MPPTDPYPRENVREYRKTATVMAGQAPAPGIIPTLEGDHSYEAGDYICGPGQAGEYWPVRRSIFEATYVPVSVPPTDPTAAPQTACQYNWAEGSRYIEARNGANRRRHQTFVNDLMVRNQVLISLYAALAQLGVAHG